MGFQHSIKFPIKPIKNLDHNSNLVLIGSCFTENIGNKLINSGFDVTLNPFGILFNPMSIGICLNKILKNEYYSTHELFQNHEGRFVSFQHHGAYSGFNSDEVIEQINNSIKSAHKKLKTADTLIITLGSAWIYEHLPSHQIVANCHKIANQQFKKRLLKVSEIVNSLKESIDLMKTFNPDIKIIFTISPVKHLRDGVIENQQSKAILILAIYELLNFKDDLMYYFPAYEIVNDELRDYRFFETDFAHPNQLAIDYIWERFKSTYFTEKAAEKSLEAEALNKALMHKTLHAESKNESLDQKIKSYLAKFK